MIQTACDARDVAQEGQKDVEPELAAQPNGEKNADRRKQDRKKNAEEIAHYRLARYALGPVDPAENAEVDRRVPQTPGETAEIVAAGKRSGLFLPSNRLSSLLVPPFLRRSEIRVAEKLL